MKMQRGDTLVEVLLATVVLSIIMAGSYSLTSRATRLGQGAIERTEASKRVEEHVETLRAMQATQSEEWKKEFVDGAHVDTTVPNYDICEPTSGSTPFFIELENLGTTTDLHDDIVKDFLLTSNDYAAAVDGRDDLFAVWVEAYRPATDPDYIDFHVRACWNGLGTDVVNRTGSILRLSL